MRPETPQLPTAGELTVHRGRFREGKKWALGQNCEFRPFIFNELHTPMSNMG